ncbi:MAG TPA: TIM barrel protein [Acidimicrobiia bacterium]|nr:TIM barrel protein [Acidimicrobiia bacterium]
MRFPLGVVDLAFRPDPPARSAARAAQLGFDHIDVVVEVDPATLALPVGCPTAFPKPRPGWCSTPAPRDGPDMWDRTVRWFRAAPGAILEPWAGATVCSVETVHAIQREVPGLRLLVDTGHVADWGGDPLELLDHADHVQLRQGRPGSTQLHVDDPTGTVDFGAVLARLDALDYRGRLSIEYFDLPEYGWPLDDPLAWAQALAGHVRALMS